MYLEIFQADFAVFRVFWGISRDFAEIPEFRGSATARNIRSPGNFILSSKSTPWKVIFIIQPPSPLEFLGPLTSPPTTNFQFPPWWGTMDIFWNHAIYFENSEHRTVFTVSQLNFITIFVSTVFGLVYLLNWSTVCDKIIFSKNS